jgi:hypothetical protein
MRKKVVPLHMSLAISIRFVEVQSSPLKLLHCIEISFERDIDFIINRD